MIANVDFYLDKQRIGSRCRNVPVPEEGSIIKLGDETYEVISVLNEYWQFEDNPSNEASMLAHVYLRRSPADFDPARTSE